MRAHGLLHKRIEFPWAGRTMRLWLSQSLFSGDGVDAGTRALLDTIAGRLADLPVRRALDLGCGAGVIGVALAALWPQAPVVMSDRDALAAAVSAVNAQENGAAGATAIGRLGVPAGGAPDDGGPFDLVAANLPAKVGEPVLGMLVRSAAAAAPRGHLALVVIRARQGLVEHALRGRARILHRRELPGHTVLVAETDSAEIGSAETGGPPPVDGRLGAYLRGETELRYGGQRVRLQTAWGLPDFDTVPYALRAAEPLVRADQLGPRVLVWNPGQGLAACRLACPAATAGKAPAITAGSRDLLQVEITRHNLCQAGITADGVHAPSIADARTIGRRFSGIVAAHADTDGPWWRWIAEAVDGLLEPAGRLLLTAGSTPVERALRGLTGFAKLADRRRRGFRAVMLERRPSTL